MASQRRKGVTSSPSTRPSSADTPAITLQNSPPPDQDETPKRKKQKKAPKKNETPIKPSNSPIAANPHRTRSGSLSARNTPDIGLETTPARNTRSTGKVFSIKNEMKGLLPRDLAKLTEWNEWMYDQAQREADQLKAENKHSYTKTLEEERLKKEQIAIEKERKRREEEIARKEEERIKREQDRVKREEDRVKREQEKEERRKQKELNDKIREEKRQERAALLAERRRLQEITMKEESESPDPEEPPEIVPQRSVKEETSLLVDGYVPFMPGWREDVELPIRENFFLDEVYDGSAATMTPDKVEFTPAKMIIESIADKTGLKKYKPYKGLEPRDLSFPTPVFPLVDETYYLLESLDFYLDALEEIGRLMELISFCYLPDEHKLKLYNPNAPYDSIVGKYSKLFFAKDYEGCIKVVDEFREFMNELHKSGEIIKHLQQKKTFSRMCLHELLNQFYSRSVSPKVHTLKSYKAFSNEVYGELLPKFISKVFDQCGVNSSHKFIDLGSGVGNVTIQAAMEYGCESYGVEIMNNCSVLAERQEVTFVDRSKLFGIRPGDVQLFGDQSFVGNPPVLKIINDCDIILVNNFLFTPALNKQTLQLFLDLKVGTKIISLKKVIPEARYHDFDDDFLSKFLVEKHEFGSGCVSWTDASGFYYITTFTGQVSKERKLQLQKLHNTRRKEHEFLQRSASVNLSSSSSATPTSPSSANYSPSEVSEDESNANSSTPPVVKETHNEATSTPNEVSESLRDDSSDSKSVNDDNDSATSGTSQDTSVELEPVNPVTKTL